MLCLLPCLCSVLNCRAHLPYRMRDTVGLPTVPKENRVFHPLIDLFNRKRATVDIPLEMSAPQKVYVDGRHFAGNVHRRRVNKLYFRSILLLWQFAYYAYRISEVPEDYKDIPLDKILFKHWIPTYVATVLLTENGTRGTAPPRNPKPLARLTEADQIT